MQPPALLLTGSRHFSNLLGVLLALFAIYIAGFGVFDEIWVRGMTVALAFMVSIFAFSQASLPHPLERVGFLRIIFALVLILQTLYVFTHWITFMLEQEEFLIEMEAPHLVSMGLGLVLVAYFAFKHFGLPMLAVFGLSFFYVALGGHILPFLGAETYDWSSIADRLWYGFDGTFGRPVAVVAQIVLIFIVFGAVLEKSGAGAVLLKFAFRATGSLRGGPAHAAIVGSALFGTMNGAAVANVVSTGVFTIPLIRHSGFKPRFSAAIEATASTGGQIMPPVMGVVAFLMADVTGIPYLQIVIAATLPALFYYFSLFTVVWIEARKQGVPRMPANEITPLTPSDWLKSLSFFIPLLVIVSVLLTGRTAQSAGFYGLVTAFVLALIFFPNYRSLRAIYQSLVRAGQTCATMMIIVAAVGFVVGVINMTGIGITFASTILETAGQNLFWALVLFMAGCLVLGMGVPTGAAYLIIGIAMGPAIQKLGLPTISVHLFAVYFGVLSAITPPVALAAFAAAPIAGSKPMETGFEASRLAVAGFLIPFVFVYHPSILIIEGFHAGELIWAILAFILATAGIVTGFAGHSRGQIGFLMRVFRVGGGGAILVPHFWVAAVGGFMLVGSFFLEQFNHTQPERRKHHA